MLCNIPKTRPVFMKLLKLLYFSLRNFLNSYYTLVANKLYLMNILKLLQI